MRWDFFISRDHGHMFRQLGKLADYILENFPDYVDGNKEEKDTPVEVAIRILEELKNKR